MKNDVAIPNDESCGVPSYKNKGKLRSRMNKVKEGSVSMAYQHINVKNCLAEVQHSAVFSR